MNRLREDAEKYWESNKIYFPSNINCFTERFGYKLGISFYIRKGRDNLTPLLKGRFKAYLNRIWK